MPSYLEGRALHSPCLSVCLRPPSLEHPLLASRSGSPPRSSSSNLYLLYFHTRKSVFLRAVFSVCTQPASVCTHCTALANALKPPDLLLSYHLIPLSLLSLILNLLLIFSFTSRRYSGSSRLSLLSLSLCRCHKRHKDLNLINDQRESERPTFSIKSWSTLHMFVCAGT